MTLDRRSLFRGLVLAPGATLAGERRQLRMSERFSIWCDFSYAAFLEALDYWDAKYPDTKPAVIRVGCRDDEEIAQRITQLEHRPDFGYLRVELRPFTSLSRLRDIGKPNYDWALEE